MPQHDAHLKWEPCKAKSDYQMLLPKSCKKLNLFTKYCDWHWWMEAMNCRKMTQVLLCASVHMKRYRNININQLTIYTVFGDSTMPSTSVFHIYNINGLNVITTTVCKRTHFISDMFTYSDHANQTILDAASNRFHYLTRDILCLLCAFEIEHLFQRHWCGDEEHWRCE